MVLAVTLADLELLGLRLEAPMEIPLRYGIGEYACEDHGAKERPEEYDLTKGRMIRHHKIQHREPKEEPQSEGDNSEEACLRRAAAAQCSHRVKV